MPDNELAGIDDDGLCFAMPSESLGPPHDEGLAFRFPERARLGERAFKADGRAAGQEPFFQETGAFRLRHALSGVDHGNLRKGKGSGRGAVPQGVEGVKFSGRAPFDVRRAFEQHFHDADGRAEAEEPAHGRGDLFRLDHFFRGWTQPSPEAMSVFTQPGHSVVTLIPCAASSR